MPERCASIRPSALLVAALAASSVALSVALAVLALRPRPVLLVPGVPEARVVLPEEVPHAAVRRFGLLYLAYFDSYTPATLEERSNYLLRFVAPEIHESVVRSLSERASFAARARESSTLVLPLPEACQVSETEGGLFRFSAVAHRRVHIASVLKIEERLRYTLDLRPALPTSDDPYGFVVVAQGIERLEAQEVVDDRR